MRAGVRQRYALFLRSVKMCEEPTNRPQREQQACSILGSRFAAVVSPFSLGMASKELSAFPGPSRRRSKAPNQRHLELMCRTN